MLGSSKNPFLGPDMNWGESKVFSIQRNWKNDAKGGIFVSGVLSNLRSFSTNVDARVNDKNFERIYVQGGLNVKPLVVEDKIDLDESSSRDGNTKVELPEGEGDNRKGITRGGNTKVELPEGEGDVERITDGGREGVRGRGGEESELEKEGWRLLRNAIVTYCGSPVGTLAANDPNDKLPLNYDQVFIRDFVPSALAFLLKGEGEIVKNFLLHTLQLQSWEKTVDCYSPGQGLMPASFKVRTVALDENKYEEVLDPDFGESAIGRSLFYSSLRCAREMLASDDGSKNFVRAINNRLSALSFHIREYYWVDMKKINEIYRYKTEEYSTDAINKFNIYPEQIPNWLMDWIPEEGGYMIGNLQPAHMDFRFFTLGNLWSIVSSLGTPKQNEAVLKLIEAKWDDLVGHMPLKICYPAMEFEEWRIITGSDPKNTPWSYHNGGSWPTLLWQFTLACMKMGRSDLARKALDIAEKRLPADHWPEYYDTRSAKFIGKQSRMYQTWTIAGFLTSKMLLENPEAASLLYWDEDYDLLEICVCALSKSGRKKCSRGAAKWQILLIGPGAASKSLPCIAGRVLSGLVICMCIYSLFEENLLQLDRNKIPQVY
ncbi:hypothetical protein Leryth_001411 [Lithospermum erythrorhizon]|nr:hypothetical protein Leryth_001411 [Lithospermum erythrorhizon]